MCRETFLGFGVASASVQPHVWPMPSEAEPFGERNLDLFRL